MALPDPDPELAQLAEAFTAALPGRITQIEKALDRLAARLDPADVQPLFVHVHSLSGSAAMFGWPRLAERAKELERLLRSLLKEGAGPTEEQVNRMSAAVAEIREAAGSGGTPSSR